MWKEIVNYENNRLTALAYTKCVCFFIALSMAYKLFKYRLIGGIQIKDAGAGLAAIKGKREKEN